MTSRISIGPPAELADDPLLCMVMGSLELCKPVDRAIGEAMQTDLERAINRLD